MTQQNFYVNNKELYKALVEYRELCDKNTTDVRPRLSEYIGYAIFTIANKLANKPSYINYSYKEEMISDGIENTIMYVHNFDPKKSNNAFAYITQIIKFSFHRRILKERKQEYIKFKNLENYMIEGEVLLTKTTTEKNSEHIKDYETKLLNKKQRQAEKQKAVGVEKFFEDNKNV